MEVASYELKLDVDFPKSEVEGVVTVRLNRGESPLVLDASSMEISGVKVDDAKVSFRHDKKAGALRIEGVPPGKSSVAVSFHKTVSDEVIFGLYKSKYDSDHMLVTDLEPAEARTVFPCKDHPAFKAVFRLEITTQKDLTVISNSPLKSKRVKGGKAKFVFEPTPRMSTYLLFFGVGRFEQVKKTEFGRDVIVASRPGESKRGRFALEVTSASLRYYEKYFGVPYPLKKLHLIALPEYHTGAMENWGAITSREANVLLSEHASPYDTQGAGVVIAHEVAHQWFGDLVTMKWWDDIWLNESFATFMECKAIDRLHHDWDPWASFLTYQTFRSQATDALTTTHPIHVEVKSPAEAGQVFDSISYGKGASVLRMIESYVGEEPFRRGVASYLKKFNHSNASGEDLWASVQAASGMPVSRIMGEWVRKAGFPLVRVDYTGGKLVFTQRRFRLDGRETEDVWPIPLTFEVNGKRKAVLFDEPELSVDAPGLESLRLNLEHAGYYSVLCAPGVYPTVAKGFSKMSPYDKGGFMNDLYLFIQAGKVGLETYYDFISLCSTETHPLVIETVVDQLSLLNAIANESPTFRRRATEFAVAQADRLGLTAEKGEAPQESMARETVASVLARLDTKYTDELASMFEEYDTVDPTVRQATAVAYARTHGKEAYPRLLRMAKSSKSEIDRGKIYAALTSFKNPDLVEKTLELGISGEVSRSDSGPIIGRASSNPLARDVLWGWLQKRYERLWQIYAGSQQILLYYEFAVPRCGVEKVGEVREFFSGKRLKQGGLAYRRAVESTEIRSRLREGILAS